MFPSLCFPCVVIHYFSSVLCLSTHLSSRFRHLTPCPCVCPALIVFTCPSSSSVYSRCVPVVCLSKLKTVLSMYAMSSGNMWLYLHHRHGLESVLSLGQNHSRLQTVAIH